MCSNHLELLETYSSPSYPNPANIFLLWDRARKLVMHNSAQDLWLCAHESFLVMFWRPYIMLRSQSHSITTYKTIYSFSSPLVCFQSDTDAASLRPCNTHLSVFKSYPQGLFYLLLPNNKAIINSCSHIEPDSSKSFNHNLHCLPMAGLVS